LLRSGWRWCHILDGLLNHNLNLLGLVFHLRSQLSLAGLQRFYTVEEVLDIVVVGRDELTDRQRLLALFINQHHKRLSLIIEVILRQEKRQLLIYADVGSRDRLLAVKDALLDFRVSLGLFFVSKVERLKRGRVLVNVCSD
jgi:hypothetical protein